MPTVLRIWSASRSPRHISYDEVKAAVPLLEMIAHLGLRRRGRSLQCPNATAHRHGDRTPSASIAKGNWSWRCYACVAGGTVIDLVAVAQGISPDEAKRALAVYAGLSTSGGAAPLIPLPPPRAATPDLPPRPASTEMHDFLAQAHAALLTSAHAMRTS